MAHEGFSHREHRTLPRPVPRLGLAINYGIGPADIGYAAERGVRFWFYTPTTGKPAKALRELLAREREEHVVAAVGGIVYSGGMARRAVENARKKLGVDRLDFFLLGWLGRTAALTSGVVDALAELKQAGKVGAVGTSIHDRRRAGDLARDSVFDALMIRYNAKHPGAEQDIFPHLADRQPLVIAYTATSWRQLLKPIKGIEMPPWPGNGGGPTPPPMTGPQCYRFCLTSPHVDVALTGPKTRAQLDENLEALEAGPLSEEELAWVRDYGRKVKAKKKIPFL